MRCALAGYRRRRTRRITAWNIRVRFAFKRNGELMAPAQVTYTTHDVPAEVRDIYRDAVEAALKCCTPMHFSNGMASAIPGRPISMRFIDDRMVGDDSGK
jgi:hypothetical protein